VGEPCIKHCTVSKIDIRKLCDGTIAPFLWGRPTPWMPLAEPLGSTEPRLKNTGVDIRVSYLAHPCRHPYLHANRTIDTRIVAWGSNFQCLWAIKLAAKGSASNKRLKNTDISYMKNIHVKCYRNPIWNDGALGFLKRSPQQLQQQNNNKNNRMSTGSDRRSVPDLKSGEAAKTIIITWWMRRENGK